MSDLDEVLQAVAQVRGLPNAHDTDDATCLTERDRLCFAACPGLCFTKGIPEPAMDGPTNCFHRWVAARMAA